MNFMMIFKKQEFTFRLVLFTVHLPSLFAPPTPRTIFFKGV